MIREDEAEELRARISQFQRELTEREERIVSLHGRIKQLETDLRDVESFRKQEKQQAERDVMLLLTAISAFGGRIK